MEEVAKPDAIMLQYANPMAANCLALGRLTQVPFIGLCHGVQTTLDLIAGYCGIADKHEITYICGGINHMDWFLRLEHKGRDLYPELREMFEKPEYYKNEKVRGEVFRHFGYFMTESTGHLCEYVPWFRKNRDAIDLYCDEPAFGGESGAYYKWGKTMAEKYAKVDPLEFEATAIDSRSVEYCSWIMEAVATGRPFRFMGNVCNDGYIDNLPRGCCVEVPAFADDTGIHPTRIGALPPQCAAACMTNVNVQQLTRRGRADGRPRAHRPGAGARPADGRRLHAASRSARWPPRCWRRSGSGCPSSRAGHPPDADHQHSAGCRAGARSRSIRRWPFTSGSASWSSRRRIGESGRPSLIRQSAFGMHRSLSPGRRLSPSP